MPWSSSTSPHVVHAVRRTKGPPKGPSTDSVVGTAMQNVEAACQGLKIENGREEKEGGGKEGEERGE